MLSAALGAALVMGMAPAHGAQAANTSPTVPLSEAERALDLAEESGKPVEVVGERSEFTTTYANPDGESFQLEQSAVPIRVKTAEGSWATPDATLELRADGTVGPKAAVVDVSFSNGGAGEDLVELEKGNRSLSLGWPGTLPRPVLDGPNATYREVLPGVDLRMTATLEGYREVLVVKTQEAAANPALKRIEFAMESEGLTVAGSKEGGFTASDSDGEVVFTAPPALMWDSRGDAGTDSGATGPTEAETAQAETEAFTSKPAAAPAAVPVAAVADQAPDVPATAAAGESPLDGPDQDDAKADVPVEVDHDSVTIIPDPGMLSTTAASAFPIYIDPPIESNEVERTLLRNDGVEIYGWGNDDDNQGKGVGKCGTWNGYVCGSGYVQRLYFEFTPTKLQGKIVLDATFRITEPWAFQCDPRNVLLVRTATEITKSTTWATKPAYQDLLGDRWVSAGRGSLCDPNSPTAPIEFNDNPDEPDENLTPTVRDFADGKFDRLTLELRAEDESDATAWKRFRNDAVLSVKYVGRPGLPTDVAVNEGGADGDCAKNLNDPMVIDETKPRLRARAQTAPGGEGETNLRVMMVVDKQNSDGGWSRVGATESPNTTDGDPVAGDSQVNLVDGPLYRYIAWVRTYNGSSQYWGGPLSAACYFKVDTTAPKPPVVEIGSPYTDCEKDCTAKGGPGRGGDFTFKPAAGDTNTAYRYRLDTSINETWSAPIQGATAEVTLAPNRSGLVTLAVKAYDGFKWSTQTTVKFNVARRAAPVAHWNFNETSGPALDTNPLTVDPAKAALGADADDAASLGGSASRPSDGRRGWVPEYSFEDRALKSDGTDGYAATKGRIVDTQSSYTISAWVRPDRVDKTFSVVGQAANFMSGVSISHHAGATWSVRVPTADDASADISTNVAMATRPAVAGVWTHITASYSGYSHMLRLYINGEKQDEVEVKNPPVDANGPLSFGRIKYRGSWVDYFPGLIDEVTVWQDLLTAEEIKADANLYDPDSGGAFAELVANWNPEGTTGSTLSDTSGYNRDLALSSGASLSGEHLILNGSTGAGTIPAPPLDETGSFTVTTRVDIDGQKLAARPDHSDVQVLGQRTSSGSAWGIWFEKTGVDKAEVNGELVPEAVGIWHFGRRDASSSVSVATEPLKTPSTQVTGVYDAQAKKIYLYLGGRGDQTGKSFTAAVGSGQFAVGKGYSDGQWGDFLPGRIGEVRLWTGAFNSTQILTRVMPQD